MPAFHLFFKNVSLII